MRRAALIVAGVTLAIVLGVATLEILAIAALSLEDGRYVSARRRFRRETNRYVAEVTRGGPRCQYVDSLFPHPYLGFVHHGNPPCGLPGINNIGLFGVDFPSERLSDRFVVLVTGGSVAAQFAQDVPGRTRYLEAILNESYMSPTGHPFLVLNGGDGAWKQPQQAILFLLWSDVVDAVVTLDGYNEMYVLGRPRRFEQPANNFALANPLATEGYDEAVRRWAIGRFVGWASRNPITSRSHAVLLGVRGARALLEPPPVGATPRRTTVENLFTVPPAWDYERRIVAGLAQYKKYIRAMHAIARDHGVRAAYFIQPVPAIGKHLTLDERAVVGDLSYGPLYRRMVDALLGLREDGLPVFSLVDIFKDTEETLYADSIHLRRDGGGASPGYRLMAQEMAHRLREAWDLKPRR